MAIFSRILDLDQALKKKSHFLFGPRATGKSWLIRHQLRGAQVFDLLDSRVYSRLLRNPHSISQEINKNLVVIDEVQKLPVLLDEVHRLIEEKGIRFLMTGSSARKLKRGGANLLAGRARSIELFPLTSREIENFEIEKYCSFGGLPMIYSSAEPWENLHDYVDLYLREEIVAEAIVRRADHFARFVDVLGVLSGEELNMQQIASDAEVPPRTVANFIEVAKDTLLAFELLPFRKSKLRKAVTRSKIFIFDVGVANFLAGRKSIVPRSEAFGKAFEHFVIQEVRACISYQRADLDLSYWRTEGGNFEVDCIVGDKTAIEIKAADKFSDRMLVGLKALKEEKKVRNLVLVTRDPVPRMVDGVAVLPYPTFLENLWQGEYF